MVSLPTVPLLALSTWLNLQLFAGSHNHQTAIYNAFAKDWHFWVFLAQVHSSKQWICLMTIVFASLQCSHLQTPGLFNNCSKKTL